jgi:hypothetical protein
VSDAAGHLTDGSHSFAALQSSRVFVLVCVLDDGQIEIEQLIECEQGLLQVLHICLPVRVQNALQSRSQPREGDVGVDLFESNFNVPPAHLPTAGDIIPIIAACHQFTEPLPQCAL